jgi:hypothetical protein
MDQTPISGSYAILIRNAVQQQEMEQRGTEMIEMFSSRSRV